MVDRTHVLRGNDALSRLIDLWVDGFCSGAASAAVQIGVSEEKADDFADAHATALRSDPLAMAVVEQQVKEWMTDTDSGPKSFTVRGGGE